MKFYIETFGCKVNTYESNYMSESLQTNGFLFTTNMLEADIIVINTCTVTNTADKKCQKYVRKTRRENSNSILIVVGCSVQNNHQEYQEMGVDILLGNTNKSFIVKILKEFLATKKPYCFIEENRNLPFEDMIINKFDHTRAFIKIQDGCDNFCSYCIIPFMRGVNRSKEFSKIICEAKTLVQNNHKEIVLTGIHTGSYHYNDYDLVDVINALSKIPNLERIRLSSVEITELNAKFMEMLKENPKFCNHLHIPLQSGSQKILKLMNRKYDPDFFRKKIALIRSIRPDISITTDIIVGFPSETSSDFLETYELAKELEFSKIHVFPYSKRSKTVASKMPEVASLEKKQRVQKLLELSRILENKYQQKFIGQKVAVLIEEVKDNKSIGHTSNYLKVVTEKKFEKNKIYEIEYAPKILEEVN